MRHLAIFVPVVLLCCSTENDDCRNSNTCAIDSVAGGRAGAANTNGAAGGGGVAGTTGTGGHDAVAGDDGSRLGPGVPKKDQ